MKRNPPRYVMTDHICRHCRMGRVLMQVGVGPSGGGNGLFVCPHCEQRASGLGEECLCMCGEHNREMTLEYACSKKDMSEKARENGWQVSRSWGVIDILVRVIG